MCIIIIIHAIYHNYNFYIFIAVSDYDAGFVGDITVSTTGTRCINIDIIPDAFFECREEFTVILQVLDMPNVECSTVIAIIDDGLEGKNVLLMCMV